MIFLSVVGFRVIWEEDTSLLGTNLNSKSKKFQTEQRENENLAGNR